MSTKLDLLITLVDNLDARSTQLLNSIQETNYLVTDIMSLNNDISKADKTIDLMDDLVSSNYTYLSEFENLYERSFLLESNMHLNDVVTSETTLDNLRQEYRFLVNRFTRNDDFVSDHETPTQVSEEEATVSTHFQTPPRLHNSISVSNLKLKPIRCRSKRMPTKKASMRVLSTSTVKLVEKSEMLLLIPDEDEITTPVSNIGKRLSTHDLFNAPLPKKVALSNNEATITDITQSPPSKIMDTFKDYGNDDSNTISTSPDLFGELHSRIKVRSNSLPETPKLEKFELNSFNILKSHTSNTNSSNIFQDCNNDSELLRLNRLKHFISSGNVQRHVYMNRCETSLSNPFQQHNNQSTFEKTPTFTPVDMENNNIDQFDIESISVCSDFSEYPPEEPTEELDNFESFLRKSRIDLSQSFPNIITKAKSHDSVFTNEELVSLAASVPSKLFKFHNPVENVNLNSLKVATTTVEPIYYHGGDQISHSSRDKNNKGNTTKLLNDVMSKTDRKEASTTKTPNRIKKSLFNFNIPSPSKSIQGESLPDSNIRRGSFDLVSKSLTDSFMNFVNTGALEKLKKYEPHSSSSDCKSKSINVFEQTNNAKERPIVIRNDTLIKRLPPRRKDGAHSNLIIGPNRTKIVNHGDQSIFKKPLMTKVSRNSLNEALSQSIL